MTQKDTIQTTDGRVYEVKVGELISAREGVEANAYFLHIEKVGTDEPQMKFRIDFSSEFLDAKSASDNELILHARRAVVLLLETGDDSGWMREDYEDEEGTYGHTYLIDIDEESSAELE